MGVQDANFNGSIFRKDNPIILAVRRDKAVFMSARVLYDSAGYMPGQVLARRTSTGIFEKWSSVSGATYDSPCILFDQLTNDAELANGDGSNTVSGASLVRVLQEAIVYTSLLLNYDSNAKTALKSTDFFDGNGVALTKF